MSLGYVTMIFKPRVFQGIRVEDRLMIYLHAHELFTENITQKYVFHANRHTFELILILSRSTNYVEQQSTHH